MITLCALASSVIVAIAVLSKIIGALASQCAAGAIFFIAESSSSERTDHKGVSNVFG
jgi:hypothetical protein